MPRCRSASYAVAGGALPGQAAWARGGAGEAWCQAVPDAAQAPAAAAPRGVAAKPKAQPHLLRVFELPPLEQLLVPQHARQLQLCPVRLAPDALATPSRAALLSAFSLVRAAAQGPSLTAQDGQVHGQHAPPLPELLDGEGALQLLERVSVVQPGLVGAVALWLLRGLRGPRLPGGSGRRRCVLRLGAGFRACSPPVGWREPCADARGAVEPVGPAAVQVRRLLPALAHPHAVTAAATCGALRGAWSCPRLLFRSLVIRFCLPLGLDLVRKRLQCGELGIFGPPLVSLRHQSAHVQVDLCANVGAGAWHANSTSCTCKETAGFLWALHVCGKG